MSVDKDRWKHSNKCIYNLGFHIIWCTKYRRKLLTNEIQLRLKELLNNKANELDVEIHTMECMEDHIHLFVKPNPTLSPHYIVQQFKGSTSHELRKEYKNLRTKVPTLWTRSYYVESVGNLSQASIVKYIENQKTN